MGKELPKGWNEKELDLLFNLAYGKGLKTDELTVEGFDVYGANGIIGKYSRFTHAEAEVIISCRGAASGVIHKTNPKSFVTSNSIVLQRKSKVELDLDFVKYSMTYLDKSEVITGTAQPQITIQLLKNLKLEFPPLPEQQRIVAKLDSFFAHLEQVKQRMEQIPVLLKQFRQAVLTQAVTGKLTEGWRNGKKLEDGLSIILKNRLSHFEYLLNDSKVNKTKKPKKIDESEFELNYWKNETVLPKSWKLSNLKNLADLITDGEHSTPRRTPSGNLLLSARNVRDGFISLDNVDFVPDDEFERIQARCNPEENDILISCSGTVGRISIVPNNLKFVLVRSVALIKLQSNTQFSIYLGYALRSRLIQDQMLSLQKSTAQANLFIGPIGKIVVPVPSSEEQTEIVRRVEALFSKADAIEAQYKKLKEQIDQLPQAILAKAFRGEV